MFIPSTFSAFHDETGRLNVDGMNIISNDGSNKLNRSRKARVSYKVQRTINASLNAATSTRAVSSNPNFVTRHTYNWEGVNPDGYFLDKLEPIPSALPSFQKLFQVSATALSIPWKISTTPEAASVTTLEISFAVAPI